MMERRPLASRNWRLSILLAGWLARRGATPNAISLLGMGAGFMAGLVFWFTSRGVIVSLFWLLGAGLVQLRLLCNLIDGMVAIEAGKGSPVGELYNEVPDRVSDAATLIGLGYAAGGSPVLGFLAAILAIFVAYVRAAVKTAGAPQDYSGPMAKPHRMFIVTVTALLCTLVPMFTQEGWLGQEWGLPAFALGLIAVGCVFTALRRLLRAARFLKARTV
jgi:phosphatidylglycerophosphate synthase